MSQATATSAATSSAAALAIARVRGMAAVHCHAQAHPDQTLDELDAYAARMGLRRTADFDPLLMLPKYVPTAQAAHHA